MQLSELVLYGKSGRKRSVRLRPGEVNIITGDSSTGKTQISNIIDYCCGRETCNVASGPIRDKVEWYGLLFETDAGRVFVGRRNPPAGKNSTNEAYLIEASPVTVSPESIEAANTTIAASSRYLRDLLGIEDYTFTPPEGQTRDPIKPSIRHALGFCLQTQTEIADNTELFHRQSETWVAMAYRDLFPYFLGAVDTERLGKEQELKLLRSRSRQLKRQINERDAVIGEGLGQGLRLLEQARQYGVTEDESEPRDLNTLQDRLQTIARSWSSDQVPRYSNPDRLETLRARTDSLVQRLNELEDEKSAVTSFATRLDDQTTTLEEQKLRLESVNLFEKLESSNCALCNDRLTEKSSVISAMRSSLTKISEKLEHAVANQPDIAEYLTKLEEERIWVASQLTDTEQAIADIIQLDQRLKAVKDLNERRTWVVGRISLWAENVAALDDTDGLDAQWRSLQALISDKDAEISENTDREKLRSILRRISNDISQMAVRLELEHVIEQDGSKNPVTLDIRNLTLIVDEPQGPISFLEIGSGKNWLGFGVATHLALQRHFRMNERPVPNFLLLDQPTQAFYPDERDRDLDKDSQEVRRLLEVISDEVRDAEGSLQVIITDHADIPEPWFQEAVIARWRGGDALVPNDW